MCKSVVLPPPQGVGAQFRFTRTANAGGLLELDGITVLLDGICGGVGPYLPTPPALLEELAGRRVDLAAFTHAHPDHLDPDGAQECLYAWGGPPVLGTRAVRETLSPWPVTVGEGVSAGGVTVTPIPSRHIGAAYRTLEHSSLLIEGSWRLLFAGDAAPTQWEGGSIRPDVLLAPFAYAATPAAWRIVERLAPERLVLLHLPARDNDPEGLWQTVEITLSRCRGIPVTIPAMGESIAISYRHLPGSE